ncbi:MAG: protease pro-enzyme activation domain-containing protein, partial [Solirubrobacteraceae bacterium]
MTCRPTVAVLALTACFGLCAVPSAGAAAPSGSASQLQLVLPLAVNATGLERFALAVSTPGSPQFGRHESIPTISRRFGASPSTRARVVTWLRSHGARHVRVDATGDLAEATMTASLARRLFAAPPAAAAAGAGVRKPGPGALVPRALRGAAQAVFGLEPEPLPLLSGVELRTAGEGAGATASGSGQPSSELPRTGTPGGCAAGQHAGEVGGDPRTAGFTPLQYLTAYDFLPLYGAGLKGQGQRVALIETDGLKPSDVQPFVDCAWGAGTSIPPIHEYPVGIGRLLAPGEEATTDTELTAVAAPGLAGIDLYETRPDITHVLEAITAPLQHPHRIPEVISVSLGACEPTVRAALGKEGLVASQFALEAATGAGVTVVAAAGDTGSAGCQRRHRPPERKRAVLYPASSWFVAAVGGTNLDLTPDNHIAAEVVWNDTHQIAWKDTSSGGAGGGGLSRIFTRPPYQNGFVKKDGRAVPDVAMLADVRPGYAVYCNIPDCRRSITYPWTSVGGTSAAAPLFAAGIALADQALRAHEKEYLGFFNPVLYAVGKHSQSPLFNDVTRIGNDVGSFLPGGGGPLGCCTGHTGYDEASGLGSVDIAELEQFALAVQPHRLGDVKVRVLPHQHPLARNVLKLRISCSQACHAIGDVVVRPTGKRARIFEIYSPRLQLQHRGSKTVRLRFTAAQ